MSKTMHYLDNESFKEDCDNLTARNMPFKTGDYSITVDDGNEVVLVELKMAHFIKLGKSILITNNNKECFGHNINEPLTCPKKAAELYMQAIKQSRSWYYCFAQVE